LTGARRHLCFATTVNDTENAGTVDASAPPREVDHLRAAAPRPWLVTAGAVFYVFLWASAFVPSRIIATCAPPLWVLSARFLCAGAILVVIARAGRLRWPSGARAWGVAAAYGVLANAMYLGLNYEALRHLSSGMGAIIASTNPLLLAVFAPLLLRERLSMAKAIGLSLGFLGVLVAMHARAASSTARPADVLLSASGVLALVVATIVFKRARTGTHPLVINAISLVAAGLAMVPCAAALEGTPHLVLAPRLLVSFAYLVVVLSIGASLLWFWILSHGEASRVSAFYFLTPLFGVAAGALLLGERLFALDGIGLVVVVAGIALATRRG
jgi:drug/metabolite transporter (DMT)-like permease